MARRKSPSQATGTSSLRIIGGQWRGRRLSFTAVDGLRPTGDRIRETLFNWLTGELSGACCLDLFSGSGALALEALSRGAASATLLELDPRAARQLAANLDTLQVTNAELVQVDALQWLDRPALRRYQLVFVDPPFASALWEQCLLLLDRHGWLADGAWIYIEQPRNKMTAVPGHWRQRRQKYAGDVSFSLYQYDESSDPTT